MDDAIAAAREARKRKAEGPAVSLWVLRQRGVGGLLGQQQSPPNQKLLPARLVGPFMKYSHVQLHCYSVPAGMSAASHIPPCPPACRPPALRVAPAAAQRA